jgi:uncharacterized membrane protein required for colicin V production
MVFKQATAQAVSISEQVKAQSLTAIVGGFSFASAIAWMDAVRWMISQVVKVQRNGGSYYVLTALFTTLLAVIAFTVINKFVGKVDQPDEPIYAVGRM